MKNIFCKRLEILHPWGRREGYWRYYDGFSPWTISFSDLRSMNNVSLRGSIFCNLESLPKVWPVLANLVGSKDAWISFCVGLAGKRNYRENTQVSSSQVRPDSWYLTQAVIGKTQTQPSILISWCFATSFFLSFVWSSPAQADQGFWVSWKPRR